LSPETVKFIPGNVETLQFSRARICVAFYLNRRKKELIAISLGLVAIVFNFRVVCHLLYENTNKYSTHKASSSLAFIIKTIEHPR